jgi:hypothetical protein
MFELDDLRYLTLEYSSADSVCDLHVLYKERKSRSELASDWRRYDIAQAESYALVEFLEPSVREYDARLIAIVDNEVRMVSFGSLAVGDDVDLLPRLKQLRDRFSRLEMRMRIDSVVPDEYAYLQHGRCVYVKFYSSERLFEYILEYPGLPREDLVHPVVDVVHNVLVMFAE